MCRQAGKAGIVEVTRLRDGGGFSIRLAPPLLGRVLGSDERTAVLDALGLATTTLDLRAPMRIAGSGSTRLLIGVDSASTLETLQPDLNTLTRLSASLGAAGYFLYTLDPAQPDCAVESRMFCPALGIPEDPVSGNAHSLLAAHLLDLDLLPVRNGRLAFTGAQGHHLGRPGRVDVALDVDAAGQCTAAHVAGRAVRIFETRIDLDS
jgi:PhzF family phenazine biosynthesis protein